VGEAAGHDSPHRRRVIVDTDARNEADDQFAIVHALLTPTFDLKGLIAAHFGTERSSTSMEDSRAEIDHILGLMALGDSVRVEDGAPSAVIGVAR
jgi:purine nucleosidase